MVSVTSFPQPPSYFQHAFSMHVGQGKHAHSGLIMVPIFRIHEWGKRTGMLKDWEAGIAHTRSAYAASGWDRGPSPKQAMHGARIFRMAERDGAMSETTGFEAD